MSSSATTALTSAVDALAALSVAELPVPELQELVAAASVAADRLAGLAARALGELQERTGGEVPDADGAAVPLHRWLRDLARTTGARAGRAVREASALRDLPMVTNAVVMGDVPVAQARALARLVRRIEPEALRACQPELLTLAARCDPDALARYVRHLIATWCEPALEADERAAFERRYLQLVDGHDGSVRGRFLLAAREAEAMLTVLEPLARPAGDADARSAAQRRADALAEVCSLAAAAAPLPDAGGARPQLTYLVPAEWLSGPHAWRPGDRVLDLVAGPGARCASASYTGPATRSTIEAVRCDARTALACLGPTGQLVALTAPADTVTVAQRRALAARDRGCVALGCVRPPAFCDAHHLVPRADGGSSDLANLVLLCRRHHTAWHRSKLDIGDLRVPWLLAAVPRQRAAPAS